MHRIFYTILFLIIALLLVSVVQAATPNPGHPWAEVGNADFSATGATAMRTYTFPDANATVLTTNALVTSAQGGTGNGFTKFTGPTTAEKTFTLPDASATILTSSAAVTMTQGGTNAALTAVNGGIVYSGASAMALSAAGSAGQVLRSGGAGAPTWSTATYPATAGTSGNIMTSNGTNFNATAPSSIATIWTKGPAATGATSNSAAQGTTLTIGTVGLFSVPTQITVNKITFNATIGGTTPSYTIKACVYNEAGSTKLIDTTSTAMTATGVKTITLGSPVTLVPGNYYIFLGLATQSGTTPTLTFTTWASTAIAWMNGVSIPASTPKYEGTIASRTSGVCDANVFSPGVLTNVNNAAPLVRLDT